MECFVMLYGRNKISHESDYIFVRNGQRITARQIAYVLEKYAERQGVSTKWKNPHKYGLFHTLQRARDGTRTRDPDLGKVVLHQLSHSRLCVLFLYFLNARFMISNAKRFVNSFFEKIFVFKFCGFSTETFGITEGR